MTAASAPELLAFAPRGPHAVGVRTAGVPVPGAPDATLDTDLWYPARGAAGADDERTEHPFGAVHHARPDADPLDGAAPLVVFSHGNSGLRRQSTFLTTHLASWGFAVVAPDHRGNTFAEMAALRDDDERIARHREVRARRPRDAIAAVDAALGGAFGPVPLDGARIAAVGHSFGGWTATKLPALDPRIGAVCALAPASEPFVGRRAYAEGELPFPRPVPTLVVAGVDDVLVDLETSVRTLIDRLAPPLLALGLRGADHYHFCDAIELLHGAHRSTPRPNQPRPTRPYDELLPEARAQRVLRALVTAFVASAFAPGPFAAPDTDAVARLDPALVPL